MENQKRKVEVFTAGCPVCTPLIEMVKDLACSSCEVVVYNLADPCASKECHEKAKSYNLKTIPAVVINGQLLEYSQHTGITKEELRNAGVGLLN